jgi:hypothetical protein
MTVPLAWTIAGRSIGTPGHPSVDQKSGWRSGSLSRLKMMMEGETELVSRLMMNCRSASSAAQKSAMVFNLEFYRLNYQFADEINF